jgi:quercetin dioxygenase-like cupin family protein
MELVSTANLNQASISAALAAVPSATGRFVRPLVGFGALKIMLIAMREGNRWTEHQTIGRVSLQVLRGRIRMHTLERDFDLPAAMLLALESNIPHDVEAMEDSVFLLSVARPDQQQVPDSVGCERD